jgi:colicin import membrane protein
VPCSYGIEETVKKTKNGLYIGDTWETFLAQRDRLPNWKIPLSIAAVLHLVVFTSAAVFPDIGKKFELDNVITIDLLSLPSAELALVAGRQDRPRSEKQESASQQPPPVEKVARNAAQEKAGKTTEPPAPEVAEEAEAVEPTPALPVVTPRKIPKVVPKIVAKPASPPERVAQVKPVSLHPIKRKKKLADDIRLAEVKAREEREKQQEQLQRQKEQGLLAAAEKKRLADQWQREKAREQEKKLAARKKRQQEAEARKRLADQQQRRKREIAEAARLARQAEQAAEQARLEAARARSEYASVAQAVSDLNTPLVAGNSGFSSGGYSEGYGGYGREQRINPAVLKQYAASLNGRISSHWQLPEIIKKSSNLRTKVALTLRRDGAIEYMRIERESGDSFFDQSVIKALRNSEPLPGFPALMNQPTQEFVLSFTPQGLAL